MITVLLGHRGVGKTTFLARVKAYYEQLRLECEVTDLDQAIEAQEGRNITELFELVGESVFREIEMRVFMQLLNRAHASRKQHFIALGAGFCGEIPKNIKVWWVRRTTDRQGRIFLDRPRIEKGIGPIEEFQKRYKEREIRFQQLYHKQVFLSEGWEHINTYEPYLFGIKPNRLQAAVTVPKELFVNSVRLNDFIEQYLTLGLSYFELRDDWLSLEQIQQIIEMIPAERVLISFRSAQTSEELIRLSGPYATDWACELGPSPLQHNSIVSLHNLNAGESLSEATQRLFQHKADHYKLAPEVENFSDLWTGHNIFMEHSGRISFLPRSTNGRWAWYRLLLKNRNKLNFIRASDNEFLDQPTLFEFLRIPNRMEGFAAVLGEPIEHSRSPAEHNEFFAERDMAVMGVSLSESECQALNLGILQRLGLVAAAVTSPLKIKMRELCGHLDKKANDVHAVNTIVWTAEGWLGTNTDIAGLETVFQTMDVPAATVVWGGGGTRYAMKSLLKGAHFFSARKGEEIWVDKSSQKREPSATGATEFKNLEPSPELIVWALGRSRWADTQKPPDHWRPKYILDLNYTEDSPGLEIAQKYGAKYISGRAMFKAQAAAQRQCWQQYLVPGPSSGSTAQ